MLKKIIIIMLAILVATSISAHIAESMAHKVAAELNKNNE